MQIKQQFLSSIEELKALISKRRPFLFLGSKTSTVIPYDQLEGLNLPLIVESSKFTPSMKMLSSENLLISGSVNWQDAKAFCQAQGRSVMTAPTEELAQMLSGVATSCTGERCFGFGTLRDQIRELTYIDDKACEQHLSSDKLLRDHALFRDSSKAELLNKYQESFIIYKGYKNAPFPRLEVETDLMVGTEGQLGIITQAELCTTSAESVVYLFFSLPKWEDDYEIHLDIYDKVQSFRHAILSCELIDENSWSYLDQEEVPVIGADTIFLEVRESMLEEVYEKLLTSIKGIKDEDVFSMPSHKCQELRMKIPRAIFERNSQMGVVKKGTDVQAIGENFKKLLDLYRMMATKGIRYNLFGHFGDAHLHFNFMPNPEQVTSCAKILESFYGDVLSINGSPFAEHGIGLLKQNYIRPFWNEVHYEMFNYLKNQMDQERIFFPQGYMGLSPAMES